MTRGLEVVLMSTESTHKCPECGEPLRYFTTGEPDRVGWECPEHGVVDDGPDTEEAP